jgi:hypothetical protein
MKKNFVMEVLKIQKKNYLKIRKTLSSNEYGIGNLLEKLKNENSKESIKKYYDELKHLNEKELSKDVLKDIYYNFIRKGNKEMSDFFLNEIKNPKINEKIQKGRYYD